MRPERPLETLLHSILAAAALAVLWIPGPAAAETTRADPPEGAATPDFVNDRKILAQFGKAMEKLLEEEKTADSGELVKQLAAETTCRLDLPSAGDHPALTPAGVYQAARDSVLGLGSIYKCGKCDRWHSRLAGGVVLTADGAVATNYHVVENLGKRAEGVFGAITRDGRIFPVTRVLAASKKDDVAIVRVEATGLQPAVLSIDDPVGTPVCAITHPEGRFYTLSTGIISRYYERPQRGKRPVELVAITADFARGSSGCGIFNPSGHLAALVTSTHSIYYDRENGQDQHLQMVVKACVPARSIKALINE